MSIEDELYEAAITGNDDTYDKILETIDGAEPNYESLDAFFDANYDETFFNPTMAAFDTIIALENFPLVEDASITKEIKEYSPEESTQNIQNILDAIYRSADLNDEEKANALRTVGIVVSAMQKMNNEQIPEEQKEENLVKIKTVIDGEFNKDSFKGVLEDLKYSPKEIYQALSICSQNAYMNTIKDSIDTRLETIFNENKKIEDFEVPDGNKDLEL